MTFLVFGLNVFLEAQQTNKTEKASLSALRRREKLTWQTKITLDDNSAIVRKILQHSESFCEILQNSVIDVDIWEE